MDILILTSPHQVLSLNPSDPNSSLWIQDDWIFPEFSSSSSASGSREELRNKENNDEKEEDDDDRPKFLNREFYIENAPLEKLIIWICRYLEMSTISVNLFGICTPINDSSNNAAAVGAEIYNWFLPDTPIKDVMNYGGGGSSSSSNRNALKPKFYFRNRFKVPNYERLFKLDKNAFQYLYSQVGHDFVNGTITSGHRPYKKNKMDYLVPILENDWNEEQKKRTYEWYQNVLLCISTMVLIDIRSNVKSESDALKSINEYCPKQLWLRFIDKVVMKSKNLQIIHNTVTNAPKDLNEWYFMEEFLCNIDSFFPKYFQEEFFNVLFTDGRSDRKWEVTLIVSPPRKIRKLTAAIDDPNKYEEFPVALYYYDLSQTLRHHQMNDNYEPLKFCDIDDIYSITINSNNPKQIEVTRKSSIALYFEFSHVRETKRFLSLVSGYYRLCEKWTFSLSRSINYPSLAFLHKTVKIHGPVTKDLIDKKFKEQISRRTNKIHTNYYLIHQCHSKFDQYNLFVQNSNRKEDRKKIRIIKAINKSNYSVYYTADPQSVSDVAESPTLEGLIANLIDVLKLDRCIYPSEFDKDTNLLLCRFDEKFNEDVVNPNSQSLSKKNTVEITSVHNLIRYDNSEKYERFITTWKGEWRKSNSESKTLVTIKKFNGEVDNNQRYLPEFLSMCEEASRFDNSSLIRVLAVSLQHKNISPCLITEYVPLGPLDAYLQKNAHTLHIHELLEASVSLAKALCHLSEINVIHGFIRCSNIYVAAHDDHVFRVKLGDSGMNDYENIDHHIHWVPYEHYTLVNNKCIVNKEMTNAGDLWAFATTLWEIFSFGKKPWSNRNGREALQSYKDGYHLEIPDKINEDSRIQPIYNNIMRKAWKKREEISIYPSQIFQELNGIFYQVFNSEKVHTYVPIPGDISVHSKVTKYFNSEPINVEEPAPEPSIPEEWPYTPSSDLSYCSQNTSSTFIGAISICMPDGKRLEYNRELQIGEGNYGIVYRGVLYHPTGDSEFVAVKKLKDQMRYMDEKAFSDMERERDIMKQMDHRNVVRMTIDTGEYDLVTMEFCKEGSLDNYLRDNKVKLQVDNGFTLFRYAEDIAEGMNYLTSKGIVHRDLAARNILVYDEDTVKISDFGLARKMDSDNYKMQSKTLIPVKWLAIECLTQRKYSKYTDVWAFGVTLWEMFSYGQVPNLPGCERFFMEDDNEQQHTKDLIEWIRLLDKGERLAKTIECPFMVYNEIMLPCWNSIDVHRPDFLQLKEIIQKVKNPRPTDLLQ